MTIISIVSDALSIDTEVLLKGQEDLEIKGGGKTIQITT